MVFVPRWLRAAPALALLIVLTPALRPPAARAEGSPAISLAVGAPSTVLLGAHATVTLTAANPSGQPYGYNVSYRAILPEGISYVAGSGQASTGALEPKVIANEPEHGETTLIWSNVADLAPASSNVLTFQVAHSTSHYTVGDSYKVEAGAYISEAARYVPQFNSEGKPEGPSSTSFTGYATGSKSSTLTALQVSQAEESPEGEILRGVHDHQVVYKLKVTNTSVGATGKVLLSEYLPADLEYLGCGGGGADHTKDAPTNPGSPEEYPGSGAIVVPALGGCVAPSAVETLLTDPDGGEELPDAVYTHVTWELGTLGLGESRTFEFRAAVPLRENTTTWTGKEPTAASGEQAANLDNNSGRETTDGEAITTFAKASGNYDETTPVSADEHLTRVAKDLTIEKSASSKTLADSQVTVWTLTLNSSEYRYNTGAVVTDTVPNGLCPLSSTNLTASSECEPDTAPSSPYASATEETNGTWKLVWNETSDSALANIPQNGTTTITYDTKTRTHYQHEHAPAEPILANDTVTNTVLAQATTNVVCDGDTDCSGTGETPIDHERPLSEPVSDGSSASQTSVGPTIAKEVGLSGTECLNDTYTTSIPIFHPGDVVCWRLTANFPTTIDTKGLEVTDFLPIADTFEEAFNGGKGEAATASDTLPGTTFNHSAASATQTGGQISWMLPEEGHVNSEGQRFQRVYATTATLPHAATLGELQGNLMKFANVSTPGEAFSYRAEANYELEFPQLSLAKQIVEVGKTPIAPTTSATVKGGQEATFALTVTNAGSPAAGGVEVRDELPAGLTCATITAISLKGACASGQISWGETGLGETEVSVPAEGATVLHFTVLVPTTVNPADTLEDHAGVVKYESATNSGSKYRYVPAENIDPLLDAEANMPAANAQASLKTEDVKLEKTHTTSVVETGNNANQATIGESVTYEVSVTIPAGTTLGGIARLTDPALPNEQLTLTAGTVQALVNGSAAPASFKAQESGGSPLVVLPENYEAPTGESVKVTMRFAATVANVAANKHGESIANTGKLSWTDPLTGAQSREASNSVPLVEPSISLSETNNAGGKPVVGDQLVEYKLKVNNAAGASTAFDTKVVANVPTGVTLSNKAGVPYKEGEAIESGGVWDEATRTVTWMLTPLEGGTSQTLAYHVTVIENPVSSTSLTSSGVATTTSMSGEVAGERTAANDPISGKPGYEAKVENSLEVQGASIEKQSDSATATIGHRITYTLKVTVPAHVVAYDETVIDTLPDSLDFDEYVSAACTSGCPPAIVVHSYTPKVNASGTTTVAWDLGDIEAAGEARTITIVYRADVRATHRNGGAKVQTPTEIANSADVYYDKTNKRSFEENTIPAPAELDAKSGPVEAKSTLVEPVVTLTKEASVDGGAYSKGPITVTDGDSVRYRLKIANSGGVTAYGVEAKDLLPSQLTEVKETTNAADVTQSWSEGKPEIRWKLKEIAPNSTETVELGYEAKLVSVKSLKPAQEFTNSAAILGHYYGVPQAEREAGLKNYAGEAISYREYTGPSAAVKAKVALPTITVEKTTGATGFPTSATAEVNQPFTWRVVVKNTSTVTAKSLHVSDTLPANWEYLAGASFSKGGALEPTVTGTLEAGKELTWSTAIELAGGASTILTYQAKPLLAAESNPGSGATHPNKNSASVTVLDAQGHAEDVSGPFAAGPAQAQGVLAVPVLEVSKHPAKASVAAGVGDSYTITVHNSGTGVAREVLAEDTLPAGMTYTPKTASATPATGFAEKSASGSAIVWEIASIAAGASVEITVPVGTEATLAAGTKLTNDVAVHATAAPTPVEANGTITLTTSADLEAAKRVVGPAKAVPGKTLTYEVAATNNGPSLAREVKLVDDLPSGLTYKSSTPAGCSEAAGVVTCSAGDVEPGHSVAFEIEAQLAATLTGSISNTVLAESTTPDPVLANNKATASITASPQAELALAKVALTPEVNDGEDARFKLTATNTGPSQAAETKLVDTLPAGLSYVSASGASCAAKGQEVTCEIGTLAVGAKASVELVTLTSGPGNRVNTATVTSAAEDLEPANNTATAAVKVLPTADLQLEKTASPTLVKAGGEVTYTLTVKNAGPDAAGAVVVGDQLPTGETLLASPAGCTQTGQQVSCPLSGELANGETQTVQLKVRMEVVLANQTVTNTAEVTSTTFDPNLANNTASAEVQVETAADLALTKVASPTSVDVHGEVTYTLSATNAGPDTAKAALITDQLPAGESYVSNDGGCSDAGQAVSCALGDLANGATRTIHLVVRIELALAAQSVTNTAEVSSETPDPKTANNTAEATIAVAPAADLKLTKTVALEGGVTPLALPGKATYTLLVENAGPDEAKSLMLDDPLPAGETYLSDDAGCAVAGQVVSCALGDLANGATRTIHLTVMVGASLGEQTVTNSATVTSATDDPEPANNSSSASLQTGPAADVAIEKTGPASVVSGQPIAWTLEVRDNGPSTAHDVLVEDPLPSGVTPVAVTTSQGSCQIVAAAVKCELGTISDGGSAEIDVHATVATTSGTLENTATVSALEPDPEPVNNTSTATTAVTPAPVAATQPVAAGGAQPLAVGRAQPLAAGGVSPSKAAYRRTRVTLRKLADKAAVRAGEAVAYRLVVRNVGSAAAAYLRLCDTVPAQTTIVSRGGGHLAAGHICFTLARLAAHRTRIFKVVLRADSSARGSIVNRARLSGANFAIVRAHATTRVRGGVRAHRESGVTG
jgi:large repetitive protein